MLNTGNYYGSGFVSSGMGGTGFGQNVTSSRIRQMSRNTAASFSSDIEIINKYLEDGKTDKALEKYTSLFSEVREANTYGNITLTDSQVESILKQAYEGQTGTSLVDSIEKNTSGSFWTGFKQSIPIVGFFVNDTSEAEALAQLSGDKVSGKDRALEIAGSVVGTLVFSAATFGLGPLFNSVKWLGNAAKAVKIAKAADGVTKLTKGAKIATTAIAAGSAATAGLELLDEGKKVA